MAQKLKKKMASTKLTLKQAVNQALRRGLSAGEPPRKARFRVEPHSGGFRPGIDLDKLNQLADELEAAEHLRKLSG